MKISFFLLPLLLSSCSLVNPPCDISTKPALSLGAPQELNLDPVKFSIVGDSVDGVRFTLTEKDYRNLSLNIEKIKRFIIEQQKIMKLYKEYYEEGNNNGER